MKSSWNKVVRVGVGQDAAAVASSRDASFPPPACRRREESFAVENDRSEGGLTLIAGNTWWNTRGSRPGTVGTKGPPCDLSLIVLPSPSDWPTTSKTVLPRHYSPHSIYDPRRASWPDTNLLSLSLSPLVLSPFYSASIGREIGQESGGILLARRKRWI